MSTPQQPMSVVGLGVMGRLMAGFMVEIGIPTVGYDVSRDALEQAAQLGVESVASLSEVASRCATVLLVESQSVALLDVALVGGARALEQHRLTPYRGGTEETPAAFLPAFRSFATNVSAAGPSGSAQVAKAANNVLLWSGVRIDLETLALARALGLDPSVLRPMLADGSGANQAVTDWGLHRPQWPSKDSELALALADEAGVAVPYMRQLGGLVATLTPDNLARLVT